MKQVISGFLALILVITPLFGAVQAHEDDEADFNPGMIVSDAELFMTDTMSVDDIQNFLNAHSGILKTHVETDLDGLVKTAATIIFEAAQRHRINPRYLLVLLQKEQGLITDGDPYQSQLNWATGYAVCDSCDVNHPYVKAYKGFPKQVDQAAWRTRYFYENIGEFVYQDGQSYTIDGRYVFIKNRATAALYNYTPHIRGNHIFWQLWERWFETLDYPDGTLLQAYAEHGVWLIENGKRHAFTSKAALTTRYDLNLILQVPSDRVYKYERGPSIAYSEFSLLKLPSGKIYMIVDNELRWIIDEFTFRQLGFTLDEVENVTADGVAYFSEGAPITTASLNPLGALLQDPDTFGVYYVKDGIRHPLIAPELLSLNFAHLRTRPATRDELDRYTKGEPVSLKNGLLVKAPEDPKVYIIADGKKLVIDSEFTFNSLGYDWTDINIVTADLLELHPEGDMVSVKPILTDEEAATLTELIK